MQYTFLEELDSKEQRLLFFVYNPTPLLSSHVPMFRKLIEQIFRLIFSGVNEIAIFLFRGPSNSKRKILCHWRNRGSLLSITFNLLLVGVLIPDNRAVQLDRFR